MEGVPLLFSLLFFTAFATYLFFGMYTLQLNPEGRLNKAFLAVCASLCFWSFGFSLANSAPSEAACLFWRRFSALGWTSVYTFLLHFLLLLTGRFKHIPARPFAFLLYLPTLINLYVFALSPQMAPLQYNPVRTDYGWVNAAINNGWDFFFYAYYIGYVSACLGIVWHWGRRTPQKHIHRQGQLIFASILAALVLGSLTDVVLVSYLATPLPQMAPLFTLIPIAAIHYSIKHYNLMRKTTAELILNPKSKVKLQYHLSILFLAGGLISLLAVYLPHLLQSHDSLKDLFFVSKVFLTLGIFIFALQFVPNRRLRSTLVMAVALLSIPLVTLRFASNGAVTVWAFPLVIMMASLVFSSRAPLILVTATAILTQIVVWIYASPGVLKDEFDYLVRMGIFILAFWIGSFVNSIYIRRLKENIYQMEFQEMVSEISFDFISISQANITEKIHSMLQKIGRFFSVDRTYILQVDQKDHTASGSYEWCKEGVDPRTGISRHQPFDQLPELMQRLKSSNLIYIEDVDELPATAKEKTLLLRRNTRSLVIVPIEEKGELLGFMGLESVLALKKWSDYHLGLLKILANLLADGLIKVRTERKIKHMAYYDHLTGLPNRALFLDRLTQAIYLAQRNEKFIGILFIDLDGFKAINDTLGHSGGDNVLQKVGQGLQKRIRKSDAVARFGGDEFLVMINNIAHSKDIATVAENIMSFFTEPVILAEQKFYITASAGVAVYPYDGEDGETLLKNADISLYKAKSSGKGQCIMCTETLKKETKENLLLSNDLYRALERQELELYYQPQVCLGSGQIIGLEALLRWKHGKIGPIPPRVFIPLAEKSGVINRIGQWVLETACRQNKVWQGMGLPHLRVGVNLSVTQINDPQIVNTVAEALRKSGLKAQYLELEITESIATREGWNTVKVLNRLKELGVSISIDDFGIEYSSLSRLKDLPIDRIKIDMHFIQGIDSCKKDRAITKIIITLAQSLGLKVLAEGVETTQQLDFLNQRMCDDVQGYYYYQPMPVAEVEKVLRREAAQNRP